MNKSDGTDSPEDGADLPPDARLDLDEVIPRCQG